MSGLGPPGADEFSRFRRRLVNRIWLPALAAMLLAFCSGLALANGALGVWLPLTFGAACAVGYSAHEAERVVGRMVREVRDAGP